MSEARIGIVVWHGYEEHPVYAAIWQFEKGGNQYESPYYHKTPAEAEQDAREYIAESHGERAAACAIVINEGWNSNHN